jgi:hypothetical protein
VPTLERDITLAEYHASLTDLRERAFHSRSEIWELVTVSREVIAHSRQLIAAVEATLSQVAIGPLQSPKSSEQLEFTQEANTCFRLAEYETHAVVRTILTGMAYFWLMLAHQERQR